MPHQAAIAYAERLREAVQRTLSAEFAAAPTVSIGLATYPDDAANMRDLIAHADRHLYEAKRLGRDRVVGNTGAPSGRDDGTRMSEQPGNETG
jgi:diguanylate cyclase (GGDEF)-like protein